MGIRKNLKNGKNKKIQKKSLLFSEKGMASIESLPLLSLFLVLLSYQLGFFGVIHTGILNSISARTFAFETFRNRTDLSYYRENSELSVRAPQHYKHMQVRWHSVTGIDKKSNRFHVTKQFISVLFFGKQNENELGKESDHNEKIYNLKYRNRQVEVNPAWIMVGYGMCLNAECGGDPSKRN